FTWRAQLIYLPYHEPFVILYIKMYIVKACILPVFLWLFQGQLFGASNINGTDSLLVTHIAQEEGLSQLGALAMDFDSNGYLWIGTENGLNRFNGYQMQVHKAGERAGEL